MLKELRRGLAKTLEVGLPGARVLPAPPTVMEWPEDGPLVWVRPADPWIDAWVSFTRGGAAVVHFDVVVALPPTDTDDLDAWFSAMDDAVDPTGSTSVFAAVYADQTLGISDFDVHADAMLEPVSSPDIQALGEINAVAYAAVVPVHIIVKRSAT